MNYLLEARVGLSRVSIIDRDALTSTLPTSSNNPWIMVFSEGDSDIRRPGMLVVLHTRE